MKTGIKRHMMFFPAVALCLCLPALAACDTRRTETKPVESVEAGEVAPHPAAAPEEGEGEMTRSREDDLYGEGGKVAFVSRIEGSAAHIPSRSESIRITSSGYIQKSVEIGNGTLVSLRTGALEGPELSETDAFFDRYSNAETLFRLQPEKDEGPLMVSEYQKAQTLLCLLPDSGCSYVEDERLTPSLREFIAYVEEAAEGAKLEPSARGLYIKAEPMPAGELEYTKVELGFDNRKVLEKEAPGYLVLALDRPLLYVKVEREGMDPAAGGESRELAVGENLTVEPGSPFHLAVGGRLYLVSLHGLTVR